jgi:hypothetical protein
VPLKVRGKFPAGNDSVSLSSAHGYVFVWCIIVKMIVDETQLLKFVADANLVSASDLEAAKQTAAQKKQSVGEVLVSQGTITEDALRRMQAYVLGIPFVDLRDRKIPFETLSMVPEPIARTHNVVAFKKTEDTLEVAMLDTEDLAAIDFIRKRVRLKILPRLTDNESIRNVLLQYQKRVVPQSLNPIGNVTVR